MINNTLKSLFDNMYSAVYVVDTERKILYWNDEAENITGYKREEILNQHCYNNLLRHMDHNGKLLCFGGCPLEQSIKTGEILENDVFLHHKLGYRVPVRVKTVPLYDENNEIYAAAEFFIDSRNEKDIFRENNKLQEMVVIDPLTKAYNRQYLDFFLDNLIEEANQFDTGFGIVFVDIDHFKNVNDTYGHDVGDEVLKMMANTIMSNIRSNDRLGRWGGEEFILVYRIKNIKSLEILANKQRLVIANSSITLPTGKELSITVSMGAVVYENGMTKDELIKKADDKMYLAKESGRNKVII